LRAAARTGTADIFGREFDLPVDAEHKAITFNPFHSAANPHMRGFWASAFGFFCTFFSTFAAAPLMAFIKKEDSLNLSKDDIVNSAVASVAGTIGMRLITGWLCEKLGARKAFAFILLLAVPGIIGIAFTQNAAGFIACRFLIGLGLATFVACQVWCSQLFAKSVVGAANATAGGWGNLGGGITNLAMPFIMLGFLNATDEDEDLSWRLCYIVPLVMHLVATAFVFTGRDLPDGNYSELESSGAKQKSSGGVAVKVGLSNINAYILTITYGFCFGVELTMTNVAALYFYSDHGLSPQISGVYASLFGLMNLFARSTGGIMSDMANKKYGMRGRLWVMFIVQLIEGAFCLIMGVVTLKYDAPSSDTNDKVLGLFEHELPYGITASKCSNATSCIDPLPRVNTTYDFNLCGSFVGTAPPPERMVLRCGTKDLASKNINFICQSYNGVEYAFQGDLDLPKRLLVADLEGPDCIRNQGLSGLVVFIMVLFSICVQMAEGLHFGVVPYVSRVALPVVSGMVGAGGNLGAVITLWSIFKQVDRTDTGYLILGIVVMAEAFLMLGIYFPNEGGLIFKAGALGKYDPQRWSPPDSYRGADQMDYSNVNIGAATTSTTVAGTTPKQDGVVDEAAHSRTVPEV